MTTIGALLLALLAAPSAAAPAGDPAAREVMREALAHSLLGSSGAKLLVSLHVRRSKADPGEDRRIVVRTRKRGGWLDRHVCFLAPADLKNTAFLSLGGEREEQLLWLPELGRVRRVSRTSRNEPFLGTTFTFRDVEGQKPDDAAWRSLPGESVGGHACDVVEGVLPQAPDEEYGRIVTWVRKSDRMPIRLKLYDREGKHVKTLFTRKIGKDPRTGKPFAQTVRMEDLRTGGSTVLDIAEADLDHAPDAEIFTPGNLRRGLDCAP